MCGILGIFNIVGRYENVRKLATTLSRRLRHRGPDACGVYIYEVEPGVWNIICHERLSICDLSDNGKQPFLLQKQDQKPVAFAANGEIYNYLEIKKKYESKYPLQGSSDCEIIGALYSEFGGKEMWNHLEGMFGVIIYDPNTNEFYASRDHVGVIPLYWGVGKHGEIYVTSELKAIDDQCVELSILLPGHYLDKNKTPTQWYQPLWHDEEYFPNNQIDYKELREQLTQAVYEQLQGDAPFGLFISGGVDSSIVAAITVRLVKEGKIDIKKRGMDKVHSFCIGLKGSPDIESSRKVAEYLGTEHHAFIYTPEEGIDAIPDVIYHTETYNNTTIRASTPMYILARKIKALGIKYCLTGEGADELFGGYLYFHKAPNAEELHRECVRKVKDLYKYDLLRANKSTMAWGLEVRPPFLHRSFVEYAMSIDPNDKMPRNFPKNIEKYILRAAFDDKSKPYLPSEILWRQKEQFSDGVGYLWRDSITAYCETVISDKDFSDREIIYEINTPRNKEQFWYRQCFEHHFPSKEAALTVPYALSIACSTEKALEWCESFKKNTDESGRAVLGIHQQSEQLKGTLNDGENAAKTVKN
ncbi:hypothetical protein ABPG72_012471 [Tetrahymena utriculariae]